VLCLLSPLVLKILDLIFKVNFENIVLSGIKVGLIAWVILVLGCYFNVIRLNEQQDNELNT